LALTASVTVPVTGFVPVTPSASMKVTLTSYVVSGLRKKILPRKVLR
jgi:hypothetical protein